MYSNEEAEKIIKECIPEFDNYHIVCHFWALFRSGKYKIKYKNDKPYIYISNFKFLENIHKIENGDIIFFSKCDIKEDNTIHNWRNHTHTALVVEVDKDKDKVYIESKLGITDVYVHELNGNLIDYGYSYFVIRFVETSNTPTNYEFIPLIKSDNFTLFEKYDKADYFYKVVNNSLDVF